MAATKNRLVKPDEQWARLKARADPFGELVQIIGQIEAELAYDLATQKLRFDSYEPPRPAGEAHDARCQITRFGAGHACTCDSNRTRRRQQVINAGRANDLAFRETLGSMEASTFDGAARGEYR